MSDSASIERLMLITDPHTLGALGITADELTDPDTRAIAIRRDHPDLGYDRHEVLHMLAGAMAEQIHAAFAGTGGYATGTSPH
jgi:hypothetical protein